MTSHSTECRMRGKIRPVIVTIFISTIIFMSLSQSLWEPMKSNLNHDLAQNMRQQNRERKPSSIALTNSIRVDRQDNINYTSLKYSKMGKQRMATKSRINTQPKITESERFRMMKSERISTTRGGKIGFPFIVTTQIYPTSVKKVFVSTTEPRRFATKLTSIRTRISTVNFMQRRTTLGPKVSESCSELNTNPRIYTNPVKILLGQYNWTGAFLEETMKGTTKEDMEHDMKVYLPKTSKTASSIQRGLFSGGSSWDNICCERLFNGDKIYLDKILQHGDKFGEIFSSTEELIRQTKHCKSFIQNKAYIIESVSEEEENFPLAYSILMYKDIGQVEHLLRAIYRPQNYYCIHVDNKSSPVIHSAALSLAECFPNVHIASRSVPIFWSGPGLLEAELICLNDLFEMVKNQKKKWKYYINLTGQEFPLKTNWEVVQILKAYNGAVDVGLSMSRLWTRWNCFIKFVNNTPECVVHKASRPRYDFTPAVGPTQVAVTYEFADFALHSPFAQELYHWLLPTFIPDESFFNTLFANPKLGVPSAYTGTPNHDQNTFRPMVRYVRWADMKGCKGRVKNSICIVALWDLPEMRERPEMFVNKLEADYHPLAYHCLEELHHGKTLEEMAVLKAGLSPRFDTRPYTQLPWVRNHL